MTLKCSGLGPVLACLLLFATAGPGTAGESPPGDRSHYQVRGAVIGAAGASSGSAHARANGTVAQAAPVGVSTSDGKILSAGFWKSIALAASGIGSDLAGPLRDSLLRNSPNPFRISTWIGYTVARTAPVELRVYDAAGRCLRTLVDAEVGAGTHGATWDGRDDSGAALASGVYFYRVAIGPYVSSRKMLLVK